ncbi:MAG TPA: hypothetical protein VFS16_10855 [Acidimicrobiia bacterium]|nr:hypothetical protein [Acidimicrobiia bacterium]
MALAAAAGLGAAAWWVTGLRPFTDPPLVAVPAAGLAAMVLGSRRLTPRPAAVLPAARLKVWVALAGALAVWQLAAFVQRPRQEHPTLSSLANTLFESHPVRAFAFVLWLAGAAALARRTRR